MTSNGERNINIFQAHNNKNISYFSLTILNKNKVFIQTCFFCLKKKQTTYLDNLRLALLGSITLHCLT